MPRSSIKVIWKNAWNSPVKRIQLIIIMVLVPAFCFALPAFFKSIEKRDGPVLHDWLLAQIPAHNVSALIFTFIWGMILLMLYRSVYNPSILIRYCLTLAVVTTARIICISLVPLSPPTGLIPLIDPLTGIFYGEATITKDLFFSGHMATLMTIFLSLEKKGDRLVGLFSVISVAVLLLVQHIHYTIDVMAAPVIVYALYLFARRFLFFERTRSKKKMATHRQLKQQETEKIKESQVLEATGS